jgi:hypothetical protein
MGRRQRQFEEEEASARRPRQNRANVRRLLDEVAAFDDDDLLDLELYFDEVEGLEPLPKRRQKQPRRL